MNLGSAEPGTALVFTRLTLQTATFAGELLRGSGGLLFVGLADAVTGDILFLARRKVPSGALGQIPVQLGAAFGEIPVERFVPDS